MEDMYTTAAIIDRSVRLLTMLEDRRSTPHNRFCSCDCSRSLRLVVRSSKIACDYTGRILVVSDRKPRVTAPLIVHCTETASPPKVSTVSIDPSLCCMIGEPNGVLA